MRIAVVATAGIANVVYRAFPVVQLQRHGHDVRLDLEAKGLRSGALQDMDVVHIHRFSEREACRAVARLRDEGVAVNWDNDDDLSDTPFKRRGAMRSQQEKARMAEMMELAHVVSTTTPVLAERYRAWGATDVQVVPNFLPDEYAAQRPPRGEHVVVGWIGAGEHYYDLEQLRISAALERLLDAHPHVRVESVGLKLGLPAERCRFEFLVEYRDLARHAASFDVGIAPIADIPFNRARSDVKLKEYAAMGAAWLASPIGPYAGLGEKQGGRLVPDDRWFDELDRLVRDERGRRKLAKRGLKWADSQRVRRNLRAWESALERAVAAARRPG